MKTYKNLLHKTTFLATNEKLIEVKLLKETLTFDTATYEYEHNGELYSVEVYLNTPRFYSMFYSTLNNYYDMLPIKPEDYSFQKNGRHVEVKEDGLYISAYVFENNKPTLKDVGVSSVVCGSPYKYTYDINIVNGIKVYFSSEECFAYHKIEAANIAGEDMPTDTGYMVDLLTFSAEQKKAIENLRKAIEKVNETCTFVCGDSGLFVINGKHSISDCDWADCNEECYRDLYESGISLPAISRNCMDNPVLLK